MNRAAPPQGLPLPLSAQQVRSAKLLMWLFVGLMAAMAAIMLSNLAVGWQTVTAVVTRIDAPRSCRSDRHSLFGPKGREWVPTESMAYCGLIHTDHGTVRLPESNGLDFGNATREALHDVLHEGCTYKLRVHGWGFPMAPGALAMGQEQGNKTLWSAEPIGSCPSGAEA